MSQRTTDKKQGTHMTPRSKSSFRPRKTKDDTGRRWTVGSSSPDGVNSMIFPMSPPSSKKKHQEQSFESPQTRILFEEHLKPANDEMKKQQRTSRRNSLPNASGHESETDTVLDMFDMFCWSGSSSSATVKAGNLTRSQDDIDLSNRIRRSLSSSLRLSKKQQRLYRHKNRRSHHRSCSPIRLSPTKEGVIQPEIPQHITKRAPAHPPSRRKNTHHRCNTCRHCGENIDGLGSEAVDEVDVSHSRRPKKLSSANKKNSHRSSHHNSKTSGTKYWETDHLEEDDCPRMWSSDTTVVMQEPGCGTGRLKKERSRKMGRRAKSVPSRRTRSVEFALDHTLYNPDNSRGSNLRGPSKPKGRTSSPSRNKKKTTKKPKKPRASGKGL